MEWEFPIRGCPLFWKFREIHIIFFFIEWKAPIAILFNLVKHEFRTLQKYPYNFTAQYSGTSRK